MNQNTLTFQEAIKRLSPVYAEGNPQQVIWGILLYTIFFLTLICLFRQRIPMMSVTIMLVLVLLFCVIDKVGVGWPTANVLPGTGKEALWTMAMRIGMFVLPLIAVGTSRSEKSRIWGILAALAGGIYTLVRGMIDMQIFVGGPRLF
jgi:hypothetical protein